MLPARLVRKCQFRFFLGGGDEKLALDTFLGGISLIFGKKDALLTALLTQKFYNVLCEA